MIILVLLTSVASADYTLRDRKARVPPEPRPQITWCPDKEPIRRVIRKHMAKFARCFEREGDLSSRVVATFAILPSGRVMQSDATADNARLARCVADTMRGLQFHKGRGSISVSYPFHFTRAP